MFQPFSKNVYEIVRLIPRGKVSTYGQIAFLAGSPRASRIVGAALSRTPPELKLPCHRVLYRNGSLCSNGAFGGEEVQRCMLEAEGIPFLPDGRVDLKNCLWDGMI